MIPILFSENSTVFTTNGLGRLSDATYCHVKEERNGINELEIDIPTSSPMMEYIELGRFIVAQPYPGGDNQIFEISQISEPINGIVTIHAPHISYRLNKIICMPFTASSCALALSGLATNAANDCPFTFTTDKSVSASFKVKSPTAIRALLGGQEGSILDVYGTGEYEFDNFDVILHGQRGQDRGVTIRYGKNLSDLTTDRDSTNVYTGIVPFVVSDDVVVTLPEKVLWGIHQFDYPYQMAKAVDFSSRFENTIPTAEELRNAAQSYITSSDGWQIGENLKVSFVNLADTEEFKDVAVLQRVYLCDTVTITTGLGEEVQAKVIATDYDVLAERYTTVEVGSVLSTSLSQAISDSIGIGTTVPYKSMLDEAVAHAAAMITGGLGGYVVIKRNANGEPEELLIMDDPDIEQAQDVWRWNSGGLGHSSTGYNSDVWDVALTADGKINANMITTGTLNADRIRAGVIKSPLDDETYWDLTSGEFHLSASQSQQIAQYVDANGIYFATPYTVDEDFVALFTAYLQNGDNEVTHDYAPYDFLWYVKDDFNITYLAKGYTFSYDLHDLPYGGTIICEFDPQQFWTLTDDDRDTLVTDTGDELIVLSNMNVLAPADILTADGDYILTDDSASLAAETMTGTKPLRVETDFTTGYKVSRLALTVDGLTSTVQEIGEEQILMSSRIAQSAHTIELSVLGTAGRTEQTAAGIQITLKDEDGNIISSGDGKVIISGETVFRSNLTDGVTVVSGSNIKGGTLTLGGASNINGWLRILNASGTEVGLWDKDGMMVTKSDTTIRTTITDGVWTISKNNGTSANPSWSGIGSSGKYTLSIKDHPGTTYDVYGLNALSGAAGLALCIGGTPYYAMNTSDTPGEGFDLTRYGFRHYFKGDVMCDGVFKTWCGYGIAGDEEWIGDRDQAVVWTGANFKVDGSGSTDGWLWTTGNLQVDGTGYSNGGFIGSDIRLKKDVVQLELPKAREMIMGLNPVSFQYIKDDLGITRHGFIAQEVQAITDWSPISENPINHMLHLEYTELIADLVKVVQDQEERIKELERDHA